MPASETSATTTPSRMRPTSSAARARSLCSWYETSFALTPYRSSRVRVRRVSSHATTSASRSAERTRSVTSSRFPIGVGQTTSRPAISGRGPLERGREQEVTGGHCAAADHHDLGLERVDEPRYPSAEATADQLEDGAGG